MNQIASVHHRNALRKPPGVQIATHPAQQRPEDSGMR
jgi:hypothetical protein